MRRFSTLVAALATVFSVGTASASNILIDDFSLPSPGAQTLFDNTGAGVSLVTLVPGTVVPGRTLTHQLILGAPNNATGSQSSVGVGDLPNFAPGQLHAANGSPSFNSIVTLTWTLAPLTAALGDSLTIDVISSNIGVGPGLLANNIDMTILGGSATTTHTLFNNFTGSVSHMLVAADIAALALGTTMTIRFSGDPSWDGSYDNVRIVPEPASLALVGLALVGAGLASRRRKA